MNLKIFGKSIDPDRFVHLQIGLVLAIFLVAAFLLDGTGDDGDSVNHYLFSNTAWDHPKHFFDHWAKPLFVLLSAPFAAFGFVGMKLFNVLTLGVSMYYGYRIADRLSIPYSYLVPLVMVSFPGYMAHILSGLTEPLFAAWMAYGVYRLIDKEDIWSVIQLSFLPFVRSEGLIVLCIVGIYLGLVKRWSWIPLLMVGHVFYGFAGLPFYGTPLWVFQQMPYAHLSTPYGKGEWLHFVKYFYMISGRIMQFGVLGGILIAGIKYLGFLKSPRQNPFDRRLLWLVFGVFSAVFVGHTIFWATGIFWSFGLLRVLNGVAPMMGIIIVWAIGMMVGWIPDIQKRIRSGFIILLVVLLSALNFLWSFSPHEYGLTANQRLIDQIVAKYGDQWDSEEPKPILYYNVPYMGMLLSERFDHFDKADHRNAMDLNSGKPLPDHMYYLWDENFARYEFGGTSEEVLADERLELIETFTGFDAYYGKSIYMHLFKKRQPKYKGEGFLFTFEGKLVADTIDGLAHYTTTLTREKPYSPGFSSRIADLPWKGGSLSLMAEFEANSATLPDPDWENAKFVVVTKRGDEVLDWKGFPVQKRMTEVNTWSKVTFEVPVPNNLLPDDYLELLIWNETDHPIQIRDLRISALHSKS